MRPMLKAKRLSALVLVFFLSPICIVVEPRSCENHVHNNSASQNMKKIFLLILWSITFHYPCSELEGSRKIKDVFRVIQLLVSSNTTRQKSPSFL